jgi:VanZ family protein
MPRSCGLKKSCSLFAPDIPKFTVFIGFTLFTSTFAPTSTTTTIFNMSLRGPTLNWKKNDNYLHNLLIAEIEKEGNKDKLGNILWDKVLHPRSELVEHGVTKSKAINHLKSFQRSEKKKEEKSVKLGEFFVYFILCLVFLLVCLFSSSFLYEQGPTFVRCKNV